MTRSLTDVGLSHEQPLVPLAALFDSSDFGARARQIMNRHSAAYPKSVILLSEIAASADTVSQIYAIGYRGRLAPHTLWENQRAWCAWFVDIRSSQAEALCSEILSLPNNVEPRLRHLIFVCVPDNLAPSQLRTWVECFTSLQDNNGIECRIFLMQESLPLGRTADSLAVGATAFTYGGWTRYCAEQDPRFQWGALQLQQGNCYWLTVGICAPDAHYHASRWAHTLALQMKSIWFKENVSVPPFTLKPRVNELTNPDDILTPKGVVEDLLPEPHVQEGRPQGYLVYEATPRQNTHRLHFNQDAFDVTYSEKQPSVRWPEKPVRADLARDLSQLKKAFYFMKLVVRRHTLNWIIRRHPQLHSILEERFLLHLNIPDSPDSLLHVLRQKLTNCREYAADLEGVQIKNAKGWRSDSFNTDTQIAIRKISAIPSLGGAFLRWGLIAVGLVWLVLSPVVWGSIFNPFEHPLLYQLSMASAILIAGLAGGVVASLYISIWKAMHALELLQRNSILQHVSDVLMQLIHSVKAIGKKLREEVDDWRAQLDDCKRNLQQWEPQPPATTDNREPFFPDICSDQLFTEDRKKQLIAETHRRFACSMTAQNWPNFDDKTWQDLVLQHARDVSRELFETIPINESSVPLPLQPIHTDEQIVQRRNTLLAEARQGRIVHSTACFAPSNWASDEGEWFDLHLPQAIAVCSQPYYPQN